MEEEKKPKPDVEPILIAEDRQGPRILERLLRDSGQSKIEIASLEKSFDSSEHLREIEDLLNFRRFQNII